jgi:hypothetical protein
MPEPVLDSARVVLRVRQGVAAGVAEHVTMHRKGQASARTDPLYKPIHSIRRERASTDSTACRHPRMMLLLVRCVSRERRER